MQIVSQATNPRGFTLAEVSLAVGVAAMFGLAAFATNQRLLIALRSQKETTAATMALQWRMEKFRATAFSNVASADYVKNNILTVRTPKDANGNNITDSNGNPIDPFAALGSVTEQFTIGVYPPDGSTSTVMSWDANQSGGQITSQNSSMASAASGMLKVDVLETWTSANGRQRQRQISTIVTVGNIGQ